MDLICSPNILFVVVCDFLIIIITVCFDIIEQHLREKTEEDYKSICILLSIIKNVFIISSARQKNGSSWCWMRICFLLAHNDNNCGAKGVTDFLKRPRRSYLWLNEIFQTGSSVFSGN